MVLRITVVTLGGPHRAAARQSTSVAFQKIGEARFEKEAATVRAETRRAVVRVCACVPSVHESVYGRGCGVWSAHGRVSTG